MMGRPVVEWWAWCKALQALAPNAGAVATGLAWASYCWNWHKGETEEQVLRTAKRPSLEAFRAEYRPSVKETTLSRHFRALVAVGLLEPHQQHSRWGSNTYVPRLPQTSRPGGLNTGHQSPVLDANSGHQSPVLDANSGHQSPVLDANSGHPRPQHRTSNDGSPFFPEVVQSPPSRVGAPMTGAGAREGRAGGGSSWTVEQTQNGRHVLEQIEGAMPPEATSRLTQGWRDKCLQEALVLLDSGWLPGQLVGAANEGTWRGVASPGAVLRSRLHGLSERPVPSSRTTTPAGRARPRWCGKCDETTRLVELSDGRMAHCPDCHPVTSVKTTAGAGGAA